MKKTVWMAVLAACVLAGAAFAQVGGVTGVVVDADGAAVEEARVSLWLDDACQGYVFTDAFGEFVFTDIPAGTYTLKAGKPRVGNATLEGVEVTDGGTTNVGTIALGGGGPHGQGGNKHHYQNDGGRPEGW